jgi:hypothetical protein
MNRAYKENNRPAALISYAAPEQNAPPLGTNCNNNPDNVHVRFAANIGRVLHARAVQKLTKVLEHHPGVFVVYNDNLIAIPSPTAQGFSMAIVTDRGRCTVVFGQWEDDFASADEAVALIDDALHGDIRLRVDIGELESHWVLERRLPSGTWLEQPRSCLQNTPHRMQQHVRTAYLHNDFRRIRWAVIGRD